jgi:membrane-bound serine protease (ClpP class)
MAKYTSIGGALPVVPAMTGSGFGLAAADDLAEGKIIATLAARFRSYAQQTSRPPGIAAAFVDPMLGVYKVRVASGAEEVLDSREILTRQERGEKVEKIREIQPMNRSRPLVLEADVAFDTGFVNGQVQSLPDLLRVLGREQAPVEVLSASSGERLVRFIDTATPVLILLGVILGFLEAKIPGFGIAGVLSTLCFSLVFYGRYLLGAAEWLEGILFVVGLLLVIVELFVAPGTLYAGVLGGILIAASLFLSYQNFLVPKDAIDYRILTHNVGWASGLFLASVLGMLAVSKFLPKTPLARSIALTPPADVEGTGGAAREEAAALVGRVVKTATDLRPAGVLEIDGRRVDAVSEGTFIPRGSAVRVTQVDGNRVVVVKHSNEEAP